MSMRELQRRRREKAEAAKKSEGSYEYQKSYEGSGVLSTFAFAGPNSGVRCDGRHPDGGLLSGIHPNPPITTLRSLATDLNMRVTEAIFAAERHDEEGARLWEAVAASERAIAEAKDVPETQRQIARRGVELAMRRAGVLRRVTE